jgi:hypothetical protein
VSGIKLQAQEDSYCFLYSPQHLLVSFFRRSEQLTRPRYINGIEQDALRMHACMPPAQCENEEEGRIESTHFHFTAAAMQPFSPL